MTDNPPTLPPSEASKDIPPKKGSYSLGYGEATHQWMSQRTAATHAAYFLPHLSPGMRLLDCGCGPGSITLGLATAVAPGETVGLDRESLQIERARTLAAAEGIQNVRFVEGDVAQLPFVDASFDAVFAHAVLYHVPDPLQALRDWCRVLKLGGLVGVRDTDYSVWLLEPTPPLLDQFRTLSLRVAAHHGASPTYARHQRELLVAAGFGRSIASASCVSRGTVEQTCPGAQSHAARLHSPELRNVAIGQGWATEADLANMEAAVRAWGERLDAFELVLWREIVGWVGDNTPAVS